MNIKLRVWDKENGAYRDSTNGKHGVQFRCGEIEVSTGWDSYGDPTYESNHGDRFVIENYTGLIDADGRKIFEGDILDFYEGEWGGKFDPEVITMDVMRGEWQLCGSVSDVDQWRRVVGNINENPDILKR